MKRIYFILIILLAGIFTTCKKYPEGPCISMRSKVARISGLWDVEYYSSNGIDSTSYILSSPYYCRYYFSAEHGDTQPLRYSFSLARNVNGYSADGEWEFPSKKEKKEVIGIHNISTGSGFISIGAYGKAGSWIIQRLTNKELWLQMSENPAYNTNYSHRKYYMKFKKISEKI